jgi:hypothetical protein
MHNHHYHWSPSEKEFPKFRFVKSASQIRSHYFLNRNRRAVEHGGVLRPALLEVEQPLRFNDEEKALDN